MTRITPTREIIDRAVAAIDEAGYGIADSDVACTADSVADFAEIWGAAHEVTDTEFGRVHIWSALQVAKGKRRGDLVVYEVAGGSVSYFGGER